MTAIETTLMESSASNEKSKPHSFRFPLIDVCVILLCVSGAAVSVNLFRLDLFQAIALHNKKPMGTVTVKYNNVQRRFSDRVLWSRLAVESPVYSGDLIRTAGYSAATLHISDNDIDINENTLIRIRAADDGEGRIIIDINSGSLNITGGANNSVKTGVTLNVMGRTAAPQAGTTMSASVEENGMTIQVNEGNVIITGEGGQSQSLAAGDNFTLDTGGVEQKPPAAVVTLPRPNARYIKNSAEQALNIRFAWNVVNIDQTQLLRLDIAADRNFTRFARTIEGVGFTNTALNAGTWHWRLLYQDTVLNAGRFTIVDAALSAPASPIQDSLFRYRDTPPAVRFEWQPAAAASYYILQAGLAPDFSNPLITRQTAVASCVEPVAQAGTWYWRVKPVFSALYEGSADFSPAASFRIERIDEAAAATADNPAGQVSLPASVEMRISPSVTLALPELEPAVVPEQPVTKPAAATRRRTDPPPKPATPPPALLPAVQNLLPAAGQRIKFEDVRTKRRIDFSWSPVEGANAYIFTLYQQSGDGGRRQVIQTEPLKKTGWTLDKLALLDRGTFVWQVEAVTTNRSGRIERRGKIAENTFIVDIPLSGNLEIEDIGAFYGL
jgi:hypothetical protein